MKRILILITLLILTACTAVIESPSPAPTATFTPSPTVTLSPTATPTPSNTPPPTATATASPSPTPTEIQPTPDFLMLPIADNLLDSTDYDPNCKLPCWQGLRVGESDREDVQRMFDEALGFNGTLDIFNDYPLREAARSVYKLDFEGIQPVGYEWHDLPQDAGVGIYLLINQETGILQGIQLSYVPFGIFHYPTTQDMIKERGTPTDMYVEARIVGPHSDGVIKSTIQVVYDDGVALSSYFSSETKMQTVGDQEIRTIDFCLNKPAMTIGILVIVAPFDALWSGELSPIQQTWLLEINGLTTPGRSFGTAEDVLGLSLDEITRIALEEDPPCFEVDVTHLFE